MSKIISQPKREETQGLPGVLRNSRNSRNSKKTFEFSGKNREGLDIGNQKVKKEKIKENSSKEYTNL